MERTLQQAATAVSQRLEARYAADDGAWAHSPHSWIRRLPPARRGRAAADIAEAVLRGIGWDVTGRTAPGHDRVVAGTRIAVKLSTLWETGVYNFQHLRADGCDQLLLLGVSPERIHAWLVPAGAVDAAAGWCTVDPAAPHDVLDASWGGDLVAFTARCTDVLGAPVAPHGPGRIDRSAP